LCYDGFDFFFVVINCHFFWIATTLWLL
jgi:hypothetical protein